MREGGANGWVGTQGLTEAVHTCRTRQKRHGETAKAPRRDTQRLFVGQCESTFRRQRRPAEVQVLQTHRQFGELSTQSSNACGQTPKSVNLMKRTGSNVTTRRRLTSLQPVLSHICMSPSEISAECVCVCVNLCPPASCCSG